MLRFKGMSFPYTEGGRKKVAPIKNGYTWFIITIVKENVNKSYVFVLS